MKTQEFSFTGFRANGVLMLIVTIVLFLLFIAAVALAIIYESPVLGIVGGVSLVVSILLMCGFVLLEPGEACVMTFFGKYCGTFNQVGFSWMNPFISAKKLSLRARNLDVEPIKVNDKQGNPIMIGLMLVWRLKDTYKAMFEIDSQTMASGGAEVGQNLRKLMAAFEQFVRVQSDAALRQVAGQYAYDGDENSGELTLRGGGDEINQQLEAKLDERLDMAGIEIVEARLNYLAYAPEIAAVMLRRQQADAVIAAREKIVEGAVSMVEMALEKLKRDGVVELDEDKKATMVSNLMVVLCSEDSAQPVVNTGTLNM